MKCDRPCGTRECQMWGCQSGAPPPEPDPQYLYEAGDTVYHRFSGEIIGIVIRRIDREYVDESGTPHPHLCQGRTDTGGTPELGKYPSYLLKGRVSGKEFEWTQRDKRLFAAYSKRIQLLHEEWQEANATNQSAEIQDA